MTGACRRWLQLLAHGEVFERGNVVAVANHAIFERDKAGDDDPDAFEARGALLFTEGGNSLNHIVHDGVAALGVLGMARHQMEQFAFAINGGCAQIGAAEVEADAVFNHSGE